MSGRFNMWGVAILGALNGIALGCLVEAVTRAYVWCVNRRMRGLAGSSDDIFCPVEYPPNWWMTPCTFMLVFAAASMLVHRFWLGSIPSVARLWQKVGFVGSGALMLYALAYDLFVRTVFSPGTVAIYAILFVLAAVFNHAFGGFVRMVADYTARSKQTSLP